MFGSPGASLVIDGREVGERMFALGLLEHEENVTMETYERKHIYNSQISNDIPKPTEYQQNACAPSKRLNVIVEYTEGSVDSHIHCMCTPCKQNIAGLTLI